MPSLIAIILAVGLQDTTLAVIPQPAHLARGAAAAFVLTPTTAIVTDRATRQIGYQLADWLEPATGYRLPVTAAGGAATRTIALRIDPALSRLGDEGYRLTVSGTRITIRAPRPAGGLFRVRKPR